MNPNLLKHVDIDVTFPFCLCLARHATTSHQTEVQIPLLVLRVGQSGCLKAVNAEQRPQFFRPSPAMLTFL